MPKLLAVLDREGEGDAVVPLLEKMAREYPAALRYPFKITMESLLARPEAEATRARAATLAALLADPTTDAFVESLHGLQHPELWLKDACKAMLKVLHGKGPQAEAQRIFLEAQRICLSDAKPLVGGRAGIGGYNRNFIGKWRKQAEEKCGRDGSKATKQSVKELSDAVGAVGAPFNDAVPKQMKVFCFCDKYQLVLRTWPRSKRASSS